MARGLNVQDFRLGWESHFANLCCFGQFSVDLSGSYSRMHDVHDVARKFYEG